MVGPSIDDDRRDRLNTRIRTAVVLLVAVSGATVAVQAGGSPLTVAGGAAVGGIVGYATMRYLAVLGRQARASERSGDGRAPTFGTDDDAESDTGESGEVENDRRRRRQRP